MAKHKIKDGKPSKGDLDPDQPQNFNTEAKFNAKLVRDGLRNVASHHVESFNYALDTCLPRINEYMLTAEVAKPQASDVAYPFQKLNIWFEDFQIRKPERSASEQAGSQSFNLMEEGADSTNELKKLYPWECRLRSLTYAAPLYATVARKFDNEPEEKVTLCLGEIPIMVRSKFCNLHKLSEEELTKHKEDCFEFGGYFIINGNERIVRMLVMTKRNYPIAFQRPTFINRGRLFSTYAVMMRCVREDMFAQTITVHYLNDGNCMLKFIYHKQEFLIPCYIMLKAISEVTDAQIYNRLVKGYF